MTSRRVTAGVRRREEERVIIRNSSNVRSCEPIWTHQRDAGSQSALSGLDSLAIRTRYVRGQEIYKAQCANCHGNAMEGPVGPPLVGDRFLSAWSARPLANLVDKIEKTMPFNLPANLSRQQSTDLVAYMDSHYRTIANRLSRGLGGHSMGGYGALKIGMKHPEVFGALYLWPRLERR